MKALATIMWAAALRAVLVWSGSPLFGQDNDAATRQYNAAVALQNGEAYDLAVGAWGKFVEATPATHASPGAALPGRLLFPHGRFGTGGEAE